MHGIRALRRGLLLMAALSCGHAAELPADRVFAAFLGDRPIGEHRFGFVRNDTELVVRSVAHFQVKVLMFSAYSYDHEARETWRDGCLTALDSETDDDGEQWSVSGTRNADHFVLDNGRQTLRLDDACVWTFAYWKPAIVERSRLVNAQTGRALQIEVENLGETTMAGIGDGATGADRPSHAWRLRAEELDTTLHYDGDGTWLGLDSVTPSGRTLHYRPTAEDPLGGQ